MALKYRNKPVKVDGIKFASKLEKYCYDLLTGFKIPFEFQRWVDLTRPFEYYGEKIRPIRMRIDFFLTIKNEDGEYNIYLDTKGMATADTENKFKLLKYNLVYSQYKHNVVDKVVWLRTKKEVTAFVVLLKKEHYA